MLDVLRQLPDFGVDRSMLIMVASLSAFLLVFTLTLRGAKLLQGREDIRRRALDVPLFALDASDDRRALRHQRFALTSRLVDTVANNFVPGNKDSISAIRKDLMQAGYFQPSAIAVYYFIRVLLAALLPAGMFLAINFFRLGPTSTQFLSLMAGAAILGLLMPRFYLSHRRKKLRAQSRNGFPDFMDLMVVCAEAGVSMAAAIERVSRELMPNYPYLGACLHMASLELRAGRSFTGALDNLADRLGIEEASNLGSLFKQSEELGTSLSDALRVYSEEMRDKRMSRAEEKAHALPAKMAVPLMVFIFPVILVVILLPAFVRVSASF